MGRKYLAAGLFTLLATHIGWAASNYTILHAFGKAGDGSDIWSGLALDQKGNVFGTTYMGGYGYGTVFKLTRQPDGQWKQKKLYEFRRNDANGEYPFGNVIIDTAGNLYGTGSQGGVNQGGTVFELTRGPDGWVFKLLYTFCSEPECADGSTPEAGLTLDQAGNLYGTTFNVFQLSPGPDGWTESVLYTFCSQPNCADGSVPRAGLILDATGNLFGTTQSGGAYYHGTVFKLRPMPDGSWKERVLHSFGGSGDGIQPGRGTLAMDGSGSLYGTTITGGRHACDVQTCGTLFRLVRQPNGHWKETILHHFKGGKGGYHPVGGLVMEATGVLYGTTQLGGTECDCGTIYKLVPNPDGTWTYTVLHRFTGDDGAFPSANLAFDNQGNLYGTTMFGGPAAGGVVFRLTP
jgi:uncharacterized repeat protein (TIGR03803 family)